MIITGLIKTKQNGAAADFTSGSLADKILFFSVPIAINSILQQLFNAADSAVCGQFAGSEALAAVGSNTPVTVMFVNMLVGLSVGSNVVIAQAIGSGHREKVSEVVHTSMLFALLGGIAMMLIGIPIAAPVLNLMGTPDNVIDQAVLYLRIYFLGMPFIVLYNFGAAILRAVGDTKRPMYCLAFSGIVNVILNLLFVIAFHMGVAGVAIATVLSSILSCILVLALLVQEKSDIRLQPRKLCIRWSSLKQVLRIGVPSMIQGVAFSLSNVCVQAGVNTLGSGAMAASSATSSIEGIDYFLVNAFDQAAVTMIGQNFGAGKHDRCRRTTRLCYAEALGVIVLWECFIFLFRGPILSIFSSDPVVLAYANERLMYCVLPHFLICGYEILSSSMRGMGISLLPTVISLIGTVFFRTLWVLAIFPRIPNPDAQFGPLLIVYLLSWILTNTLMGLSYFYVIRRQKQRNSLT